MENFLCIHTGCFQDNAGISEEKYWEHIFDYNSHKNLYKNIDQFFQSNNIANLDLTMSSKLMGLIFILSKMSTTTSEKCGLIDNIKSEIKDYIYLRNIFNDFSKLSNVFRETKSKLSALFKFSPC